MASEDRSASLKELCRDKCANLDLTNHKTGWNHLRNLPEHHVEKLKDMGYSTKTRLSWHSIVLAMFSRTKDGLLHDFGWTVVFDKDNGVCVAFAGRAVR